MNQTRRFAAILAADVAGCAAYHAAMAAISDSEKPLAMRSITVA